jgi:hypothetical protein
MIAPLRKQPTNEAQSSGPCHVGQLLPAILARYGIVMSAAELSAYGFVTREAMQSSRSSQLPARRTRRVPVEMSDASPQKLVQMPLFPSTDRAAAGSLVAR